MVWVDRRPDAQQRPTARDKDPIYLPQCRGLVGKELQPLLTQDDVKRSIWQAHRGRAPLDPGDRSTGRGRQRSGSGEHRDIDVEPSDATGIAHFRGRDTCHDPGATRESSTRSPACKTADATAPAPRGPGYG